jgi:starvation-inducible DNA-binding protein
MFISKIDLPEPIRYKVVEILNQRLAETIDLALQAKQAHWNVKGPNFRSLHKLFDTVAEGALESSDHLAERLVQLGGIAEGTVEAVMDRSRLQAYPHLITEEVDHIEALSNSIAFCAKFMRESIDAVAKCGDIASSDLLIKGTQQLDQYLWMVEAHLQGKMKYVAEETMQSRNLKSASSA